MTGSPPDVMHVLDLIQTHKMKSGLAISPNTPASSITDEMGNKADLLLVMTVHPGRGGQKFMPECLKKVEELRSRFPGKNIQVDGGVGSSNACQCAQAGTFSTVMRRLTADGKDPMFWLQVPPFSVPRTQSRPLPICGHRSMVPLTRLPRGRKRRVLSRMSDRCRVDSHRVPCRSRMYPYCHFRMSNRWRVSPGIDRMSG